MLRKSLFQAEKLIFADSVVRAVGQDVGTKPFDVLRLLLMIHLQQIPMLHKVLLWIYSSMYLLLCPDI